MPIDRQGSHPTSGSSTASCRGWSSPPGCSTSGCGRAPHRCSSGSSSSRPSSSGGPWTSSSRCGWPACEDQVAAGLRTRSPRRAEPGRTQQLAAITGRVTALVERQSRIYSECLAPALTGAGVLVSAWHTLDEEGRRLSARRRSIRQIFPILTPLAVDQGHPFPYIADLCLNLVVRVVDPATGAQRIARVKVPPLLPRFRSRCPTRDPPGAGRTGHRRPSGQHLPVDDHFRAPCLPADPQRRPLRRGGRGGQPAGRRGARAAPPPVRPGGAARGLGRHLDRAARDVDHRGRRARGERLPLRRARIDLGGLRAN